MTIDLTAAEASHLLTLLNERIEDGTYYGNREQYYARSERIYRKIMDAIKEPAEERGPEVDALLWMAEHVMGTSAAEAMRGWLARYRAAGKLVVRDADGTVKESLTVGEERGPEVGE